MSPIRNGGINESKYYVNLNELSKYSAMKSEYHCDYASNSVHNTSKTPSKFIKLQPCPQSSQKANESIFQRHQEPLVFRNFAKPQDSYQDRNRYQTIKETGEDLECINTSFHNMRECYQPIKHYEETVSPHNMQSTQHSMGSMMHQTMLHSQTISNENLKFGSAWQS